MEKLFLQMYSFGDHTPENTLKHLEEAAAMGYAGVELYAANFETPVDELKACLEKNNLQVISYHAPEDKIVEMIPYAKSLGQKFVGIAWHEFPDMDEVRAFCKKLDDIGRQCREAGLTLTYHNHTQEFASFENMTVMEHIIDKTSPENVSIELDAGWCAAAGFSPVEFVKKHSGRVKLIHIKESSRVIGTDKPGEDTKEINCPAGLGLVDWKVLKDAADANGCEAYIVEREHSYEGTRTQCLKADFDYYSQIL
ncbi:MAG TPA: sugar phosphate isomerase/epimerase [Candidatus Scybalocola faecipullorum]|nr:sugar phosphate isomerase/epimerase [Candidatus Scybalocola faecipullorum]